MFYLPVITSSGLVTLYNHTPIPLHSHFISSLVFFTEVTYHYTSHMSVYNSVFNNLELLEEGPTFVSAGTSVRQSLTGCSFQNITRSISSYSKASSKANTPSSLSVSIPLTLVEMCSMCDSSVQECEDTFYGCIIAGVSPKTLASFVCQNSTFVNSTHSRITMRRREYIHRSLSHNECPSEDHSDYTTTSTFTSPSNPAV